MSRSDHTTTYSIRRKSSRLPSGWIAVFLLIMAGVTTSCVDNEGVEYSSFVDISPGGIPQGWEFEFSPVPADSSSIGKVPFDIILVVRYSDACVSEELPLNIELISLEDEKPDSISLRIPLFDSGNEPLGKGIYSIYEKTDTILRSVVIPEGMSISVSSPVDASETVGVKAIGILASRSGVGHKARYIRNVW